MSVGWWLVATSFSNSENVPNNALNVMFIFEHKSIGSIEWDAYDEMQSMKCLLWDAYDNMHIIRWIELNEYNNKASMRCIKINAWFHNEMIITK